jgi:thiamine-phosphate diphosphorylase
MSKFQLKCPLLCLVADPGVTGLVQAAEAALAAGITMLHLRGHTFSSAHLYTLATALRPLCERYQAAFIVNDRVDVGLAAGAHGFQLGVRSLPLPVVRRLVGEGYLLGASVHSREEAQTAVASGADFLLAGTIFASHSHPGGPTSGPGLLRAIKQIGLNCPLLAIGGITSANAGQVMEHGADGIAVISAILEAESIECAVRELRISIGL